MQTPPSPTTTTRDAFVRFSDDAIRVMEFSMQTTSNTTHDAFAKYSDDAVRLKTLTLSTGDDFNLHDFANRHYATQRVNLSEDRPIARKTRISFELHPSLVLLDGLMEEWNGAQEL